LFLGLTQSNYDFEKLHSRLSTPKRSFSATSDEHSSAISAFAKRQQELKARLAKLSKLSSPLDEKINNAMIRLDVQSRNLAAKAESLKELIRRRLTTTTTSTTTTSTTTLQPPKMNEIVAKPKQDTIDDSKIDDVGLKFKTKDNPADRYVLKNNDDDVFKYNTKNLL
jgi:hypothetical protein